MNGQPSLLDYEIELTDGSKVVHAGHAFGENPAGSLTILKSFDGAQQGQFLPVIVFAAGVWRTLTPLYKVAQVLQGGGM